MSESEFTLSGLPSNGEASFSALWNGAVRTWSTIANRAQTLIPSVHATLAPAAEPAAWREFVAELGLSQPALKPALLPLRMLTLQHDGQARHPQTFHPDPRSV